MTRFVPFPEEAARFIQKIVGPPRPLTVNEVAPILGLHSNSVKRIPPSELPYFRVGKRGDRRYLLEDVRRYIDVRTVR